MDSSFTANLLTSTKFRPLIEVQTSSFPADVKPFKPLQYKNVQHPAAAAQLATRFLFECGTKLELRPIVSAKAAHLYHRFYENVSENNYDPYLIAATCLYIASKQEDEPLKIRDVVNVAHRTLNRDSDVLDFGEEYWALRDSVVQGELFVLRVLNFKTAVETPHFYLLQYLRTLKDWVSPDAWNKAPLSKICWTLLQDFHHSKAVIQYEAQSVALAVIFLALQIYGISIPCTSEHDAQPWHEVLYKEAKRDVIWSIVEKIISVYDHDKDSA